MSSRPCDHADVECTACFKDRIGSVAVGASATPSRMISRKGKPTGVESKNSWERGRPTDKRGMPYLNAQGGPVMAKELAENRRKYRQHQTPEATTS